MTRIVTVRGGSVRATAPAPQRIPRQFNRSMYFADDFGAVGDGISDDSDNLNNALAQAAGSALWIGDGDYVLGSEPLKIPSGTELVMSHNCQLLVDANLRSAIENLDTVGGNTRISIRGGQINGQKVDRTAGQQNRGIYMVNVDDLLVEHVLIFDTEDHGVQLTDCRDFRLRGLVVHDAGKSDSSVGGSCIAFSITNAARLGKGVADGCVLTDAWRAGFRGASTLAQIVKVAYSFAGNVIERCGKSAAAGGGYAFQGQSSTNTIMGLTIVGGVARANDANGIRFTSVSGSYVQGVICEENEEDGIILQNGCLDNVIEAICRNNGNRTANTFDGISIEDNGTGCKRNVVRVRAYDDQGVKTQRYGINEQNASDESNFQGSVVDGNLTAPASIIGPLSIPMSGIDVRLRDLGILTESYPLNGNNVTVIMIDGTVYYMTVPVKAGVPITGLEICVATGGVALTLSKVGLVDKIGTTRLAISADQGAAWQTNGKKKAPFTAPYIPLIDGNLIGAAVCKGGTLPILFRGGGGSISSSAGPGGMIEFGHQLAQTDIPASPTIIQSGASIDFWIATYR